MGDAELYKDGPMESAFDTMMAVDGMLLASCSDHMHWHRRVEYRELRGSVEQVLGNAQGQGLAPIYASIICGKRSIAQAYNRTLPSDTHNLEEVLFCDGSTPTAHPYNLPRLRSVHDIQNLSGGDARRYLRGYGLPVPHRIAKRREAVARAIGYDIFNIH